MRLHSIMKSAKGLFSSTGSSARIENSSPVQPRILPQEQVHTEVDDKEDHQATQPRQASSPPRQEARRTRSSTEKETKRRRKELEERQEEEARQEKAREQERQRALQVKAAQDKSSVEPEERAGATAQKPAQLQRQQSREPEATHESSKYAIPQPKQTDRRPKPTREPVQKPKPQPVSIRVGSTLSRMPMASSVSSSVQETSVPASAPAPAPASKASTLKKKASNQSLQTSSSTSSFKSSVSSQNQAQRKAQLASERKREQEEREARRKEDQKREQERKRVAQQQQQDEARRQEMRSRAESRAEAERERRERSAQEDPKKAAHMQAIEKRRLENARRHERQGSQQAVNEVGKPLPRCFESHAKRTQGPVLQHEKAASQSSQRSDLGASRPPSRLGSIQPYGRPINPPAPNPAKPPKRGMDEDAGHRPAVAKPSNVRPSGEHKRRKTEDEHNPMQPVRPTMAPPIRQSNIRKVCTNVPQNISQ